MQKSNRAVVGPNTNIRAAALVATVLLILAIAISLLPRGSNAQQCEAILLSQNRDACLISLAMSTQNQSLCSQIQDQSGSECYSRVAQETLSASLCGKAGSLADSCIVSIANATNDSSLCSQAHQPLSDRCVYSIAVRQGAITLCAQISNSTERSICESVISINYASATKSPAPCANATNSTNLTVTSSVIVGARASSSSGPLFSQLAFLPQLNITSRDVCYSDVASEEQNSSLCSFVGPSAQSLCASAAAPASNSTVQQNFTSLIDGCNQSGQYASACRVYVTISEAVTSDNLTLCANLASPSSWNCYAALAAKYNAPSDCSYIANSSANNACLQQIG